MPNIEDAVRKCPSCGRRLKAKLVSKKLTGTETVTFELPKLRGIPGTSGAGSSRFRGITYGILPIQEKVAVSDNVEWWRYSYRCGRCGHEWTEDRKEQVKVSQSLKTESLS